MEDSTGLLRTDCRKVVRPGVTAPTEDGIVSDLSIPQNYAFPEHCTSEDFQTQVEQRIRVKNILKLPQRKFLVAVRPGMIQWRGIFKAKKLVWYRIVE